MTNCKNCGAVLKSNKCEYCGTEYPDKIFTSCQEDMTDEINRIFSNNRVYVEEVVREPIILDRGRNENGELVPVKMGYKKTVKLVQV